MDWPVKIYESVVKIRSEKNNEPTPDSVWEYQMVKDFGLGFYDLDEITAQEFGLIKSIVFLYEDGKRKK